jgi:murein DD-endopeptidase MepM/ murein hydrolase activator NlpD
VSSSESSGGATRTKAISTTKIAPASKLVGEGEGGCDPSPSNALLGQLAQEYAAPPVVLSEPPGMEGPQTNNRLLPILRRAHERRGFSLRQGFLKVAGPFPVAGPASWSDDWHAYRACPYPHLHEGLDIFAHWGTPVVAVSRGVLTQKGISSMSGLYIQITNRHGFQFFYDHFSRFARGLRLGQRIHLGQVVGYVGTTGNAQGTSPHLHLEVQPGGTPTPPKPFVDRWLLSALRQARALASGRPTPRSSFPTRSYSR